MEILVVLALLAALTLLANRYGYDSRERPRSPEEQLAARGIVWEREAAAQRHLADELARARRRRSAAAPGKVAERAEAA